ncbi:unnamed protein product [Rangifer tarandus platyrhynchus]|uniref:Uncharacterized protein n=1 Tax=Rangifer tarandus platyrhynchus TaxID=3082113 RepID=A0ABN8YWA8_RANTA|nr:unnamed protein product [Rangifer tarandus platyrhynchus]
MEASHRADTFLLSLRWTVSPECGQQGHVSHLGHPHTGPRARPLQARGSGGQHPTPVESKSSKMHPEDTPESPHPCYVQASTALQASSPKAGVTPTQLLPWSACAQMRPCCCSLALRFRLMSATSPGNIWDSSLTTPLLGREDQTAAARPTRRSVQRNYGVRARDPPAAASAISAVASDA